MTETKTKLQQHYVRTAPCIRIIYSESKIHIYNGLKKKGIQKLKNKLEDNSKCKNNICVNEKYRKGNVPTQNNKYKEQENICKNDNKNGNKIKLL